jgi:hypothetical protein
MGLLEISTDQIIPCLYKVLAYEIFSILFKFQAMLPQTRNKTIRTEKKVSNIILIIIVVQLTSAVKTLRYSDKPVIRM